MLTRHITTGDGSPAFSGDGGAATSASLNTPYGVAVDSKGNPYIADSNNHRIRKVSTITGVITTIAGTKHVVVVSLVPCRNLVLVTQCLGLTLIFYY